MTRFKYHWNLSDGYPAAGVEAHGSKVFGTFICGGGSTMGYKLAGYDHIGGVELDRKIAEFYRINHLPDHLYIEDLRDFNKRTGLPDELFQLDILDGSPPCSTFSMAGKREDDWGNEKRFNEGQKLQRLDDLFFVYLDTVKLLKPKISIAENVTGLIKGNAKAYVKEIADAYKKAGYRLQVFQLNAASMGVPQKRERIFFIALREDIDLPLLRLEFNEAPILMRDLVPLVETSIGKPLTPAFSKWWRLCQPGESFDAHHPKKSFFNSKRMNKNSVCTTIVSTEAGKLTHWDHPNELHEDMLKLAGTFPVDYYFTGDIRYIIGMSVPPVMMAQVAYQVYQQWLLKLK